MRTTVDLDPDVLIALKDLARVRGETLGRVLSDAARRGIAGGPAAGSRGGPLLAHDHAAENPLHSFGFEPIPAGGKLVSNSLVDHIRDDEGL
jgi:hypothetical protein